MEQFITITVLAVLVEALWEILGEVYKEGKVNINYIGTLIIGIGLAVATGLNIFNFLAIGVHYDIVGILVTGVLISRGSNYVHDLIKRLSNGGEVK